MAVSVNVERKLVELRWDPGTESGPVQIFAIGEADDVHNDDLGANDGLRALSYPADFKGKSDIEVRTADGTVVDSGSISI